MTEYRFLSIVTRLVSSATKSISMDGYAEIDAFRTRPVFSDNIQGLDRRDVMVAGIERAFIAVTLVFFPYWGKG